MRHASSDAAAPAYPATERGDTVETIFGEQVADQRAFAHAIAPEQAHGLAARNFDVDAMQHMARCIPGMYAFGIDQKVVACHVSDPPRGKRCALPGCCE